MPAFAKFRPGYRRKATEDMINESSEVAMADMPSSNEKNPTVSGTDDAISPSNASDGPISEQVEKDALPTETAQRGVQEVEAVALTWTKPYLISVFMLMWLLYFVNAMQSSICYNLIPFATSAFQSHSSITLINIVANAMTAAIYIPLAKMLDLWGRAEGFLLMVLFSTIGLIMMAACNGIATFCAAQVRATSPDQFLYLPIY
ncbi:hypothetical protein OCU04_003140 [Sclerotinia nivalis]|uniref:Major facilitator superfamily (MFS) profile domain-containing protein n=1 Tax=Sclerotinia nivalis TaxID=352851 RepID=A0A9X0AV25_9HELO|nr:hypothetical protein OCU04_003140 [Sclerotinia nivalis]